MGLHARWAHKLSGDNDMTVSTEVDHNDYTGNGVTTTFPYTFRIFQKYDLVVQVVDLDENLTVLTLNTDYTVTGAGGYTGGNVILTTALANGYQISISRELPVTQETDLRNQGKFFAEVHEDAFDKLTMLIQQALYKLGIIDGTSIKVPETGKWIAPAIALRKNKLFAWGDSGQPIAVLPPNASASDVIIELAKPSGAGNIGTASGQTVQQNLDQLGQNAEDLSSHIQKNELINFGSTNSINSWRSNEGVIKGRKVNILGDSISFGAGAGNDINSSIPENSWVRILGSALNKKYGVDSYGFVSPYASNGTGTEIHGVAISPSGSWAGYAGQEAGHTPAGMYQESSTPSSYFAFNLSGLISTHFVIWYDASVTGSFQIVLNADVANPVATITTNGSGVGLEKTTAYACASVPTGGVQIRIVNVSGTVRVTGISYVNEQTGLEYSLNNFSRDGRAGRWMTETAIKEMCMGTMSLIYCLGANDRSATGSDLDAFKQRINWLIQYCNAYGTRLIVCDFLFINNDDHPIRVELKRLSDSVNGATLIPFPNLLSTNGEVNTSAYLINTINFSYDGVHLSVIGHRIVAEVIGRCLGVEASKLSHLSNNTRWRPVVLSVGVNSGTTYDSISKYRIISGCLELDLQIPMPATGTIVTTITLPTIYGSSLRSGNYISSPDATGRTCIIGISTSGVVTIYNNSSSSSPPSSVSGTIRVPLTRQMKFN